MNSGPGSKAEARRRNVQEKKLKLEEVPGLKRLKRLSLRPHGPTRAYTAIIVFHLFLMSKMHGYTFIEDSVPCRKAFRHDLGMTSWIQRLQW